MSNTTFLDLPIATSLDGTEVLPIIQPANSTAGVSKRATTLQVAQLFGNLGSFTGTLTVPNGGTGDTLLTANGVLLGNGVAPVSAVAAGTSGYVLTANGTGSPPTFQAAGGLSNQPGLSALGVTGNATASPAAITGTTDQVLRVSPNGTGLLFGQVNLSTSAAITGTLATSYISGVFALASGGVGTSTLTANAVLLGNGTSPISAIANATSGYALLSNGTSSAPSFGLLNISSVITGVVQVPNGGSGTTTITAHAIVLGNGTSSIGVVPVGTNGQVVIGQTGADPAFKTVSGDITINNVGTTTIGNNAVTYAKFQQPAALSVVGNTSSAIQNAADITGTANQVLRVSPSGTALIFGQVNLAVTASVTGILPLTQGGLGTSSISTYAVLYGNGATISAVTAGTSGALLRANGTGSAPSYDFQYYALEAILNGAGSVIQTGIAGDLEAASTGTLVAARLFADQTGSIVVNIWKDTYANYPPTIADAITSATPPTISGAFKSEDTTLSGWTTTVNAGDIFRFNVNSVSTMTRCALSLTIRKS